MAKRKTTAALNSVVKVTVMQSSGTFVKDPRTKKLMVELVGGGGSTPPREAVTTATVSCCAGAASGGYIKAFFDESKAAAISSVTVTVGAPGDLGGSGGKGGTGGTTSFGDGLVALGGVGGTNNTSAGTTTPYACTNRTKGGAVMVNSTATILAALAGQWGEVGVYYLTNTRGGAGGSNPLGIGGAGMNSRNGGMDVTELVPTGYGAGAGGSMALQGNTAVPGQTGGPGVVIITEMV